MGPQRTPELAWPPLQAFLQLRSWFKASEKASFQKTLLIQRLLEVPWEALNCGHTEAESKPGLNPGP